MPSSCAVRIVWDDATDTVRMTCRACPDWRAAVRRPDTGRDARRATFAEALAVKDAHEDTGLPASATFLTRAVPETPTRVDTPAVPVQVDVLWARLHDWPVILR